MVEQNQYISRDVQAIAVGELLRFIIIGNSIHFDTFLKHTYTSCSALEVARLIKRFKFVRNLYHTRIIYSLKQKKNNKTESVRFPVTSLVSQILILQ